VPREPWQAVHARNQRKFALHLACGLAAFGVTACILYRNIIYNGTPGFLKHTGFKTRLPTEVKETLTELKVFGSGNTYVGLDGLKDAPVAEETVEEVVVVKNMEKALNNNKTSLDKTIKTEEA
jgi:hypothetical protein